MSNAVDFLSGLSLGVKAIVLCGGGLGCALALGFLGAPTFVWALGAGVLLVLAGAPIVLWAAVAAVFVVLLARPIRRLVISGPVMKVMEALKIMPVISQTERIALEAGSTWMDGELFSGKPDFAKMMSEPYPSLNAEEKAFLAGPVDEVCRMVNDWQVGIQGDLPPEVWAFLKKEGFFGLIIPKSYGGREFSGLAHSEIVAQLASRCLPLAISVMVPNSLGPAELLNHYGTDAQKNYYLPRLARGEEIPCFGLTEPEAGSDAGAIASTAVVFRDSDGSLKLRLNWSKRYITLAAVSTIIGLAVRLLDPDELLGKGKEPGITCVLVPSKTKGVVLGRRHNPMGVAFYNAPTDGVDVVVSVDQIIGGTDGAGQGWRMLMECLAAGRSISLPAQSAGGIKLCARVTSAYALVRKQFGLEIGKFEGVEEPLARIVGTAYQVEALRRYTCGAVDKGLKPAVVSAIAKMNSTEMLRKTASDAMDVMGGAGISRGPRNLIAITYTAAPIGITVEGANILTRTMIIFGQGAIRCHPFAYKEVQALAARDVKAFDEAFFGHLGFVLRNACRAALLSVTRGRLALHTGETAKYTRKLAWASASFAFYADVAMGSLGGALKMKEKLTGRYADVLSWMYIATATLRRYEAEGRRPEHKELLDWSMKVAFSHIQEGFDGIFANLEIPVIGSLLRGPVALWSRVNRLSGPPTDADSHAIVKAVLHNPRVRDDLTEGIHLPKDTVTSALARFDLAYTSILQGDAIYDRMRAAVKAKKIPKAKGDALVNEALKAGVVTADEAKLLKGIEELRRECVKVDSFELDHYANGIAEGPRPGADNRDSRQGVAS